MKGNMTNKKNEKEIAKRRNTYAVSVRRAGMPRICAIAAVLLVGAAVTIIIVASCSVYAKAAGTTASHKYYASVQVQEGDTLWGIAQTYITDDYADYRVYIEEVRTLNHLSGDTIHAGAYLTVPYYSEDLLD